MTESERNKISSKKAVDKSLANGFSRDEHFKVSQDLKNLFESASLKESYKDYKEKPNILQVHRFQTELKINDKNAIAKITLFEKMEGRNKIYTLELEDLKPTSLSQSHTMAEVAVKTQVTRDVVRPNANIAKTDKKIISQRELKNGDILFKDDLGKTHRLTKETQEQWLKTFDLKSLDEDFIPQFSKEVQESLEPMLKGKEIKINQKDLFKITQKGREKYIKEILPTFREPDAVFKDEKGDLIFARKIDNRLFFANITREYDKESLNISLSPKKDNALKSKLENAKEVYYQKSDSELRDSSAHKASTGFLSSTSESDTAIIPKTFKEAKAFFSQRARELENELINNPIPKEEALKLIEKHNQEVTEVFNKMNQGYPVFVYINNSKIPYLKEPKPKPTTKRKYSYETIRERRKQHEQKEEFAKYDKEISLQKGYLPFYKENEAEEMQRLFDTMESLKAQNPKDITREFKSAFRKMLKLADKDIMIPLSNYPNTIKAVKRVYKNGILPDNEIFQKNPAIQATILQDMRNLIQENENLHPIKEFGTNYAEFYRDGKGGIQKLLAEAKDFARRKKAGDISASPQYDKTEPQEFSAQVAGAFYREDLKELSGNGEIDLVWGEITDKANKGFGLAHILDKHPEITSNILSDIIQNGELKIRKNQAIQLTKDNYKAVLKSNWKGEPTENKWIVIAYEYEKGLSISSKPLTKADSLALNSTDIIPQPKSLQEAIQAKKSQRRKELKESIQNRAKGIKTLKDAQTLDDVHTSKAERENDAILLQDQQDIIPQIQAKFKFNEAKAKDLAEWHKDSSPITKDAQGLPKVFYHGGAKNIEIFDRDAQQKSLAKRIKTEFESFKNDSDYNPAIGFWFSTDKRIARNYKEDNGGSYECFLKIKKPFIMGKIDNAKIKEIESIFGKIATDDKESALEVIKRYREIVRESEKMGYKEPKFYYNGISQILVIDKQGKQRDIIEQIEKAGINTYFGKMQFHSETELFLNLLEWRENNLYQEREISFARHWIYPNRKSYIHYSDILKKNGYDGIQFASDEIVVFDPNQIKEVSNKGINGKYFNQSSANIYESNPHIGARLLGGSIAGVETDEQGSLTLDPSKFALGFLGGAGGSKALAKAHRYAILRRMKAKKNNQTLYNIYKAIDSSQKYGKEMKIIGKENLNADILEYAMLRNKRFAINRLDSTTAKKLGFKYPSDVRRTIQPNDIIHTLQRHGTQSNLVQKSGQKAVTLDEIAKYQDYADNAEIKGYNADKNKNNVLVSISQLESNYYVVVEQIRKGQNELSFKTMYFERGTINDERLKKLVKQRMPNA
ncbi:MAG: hypothetical protein NC548_53415 [Lachnospiraceae bacterium]|nr:hypothetical protein [Lachnospiraceae bacterium]